MRASALPLWEVLRFLVLMDKHGTGEEPEMLHRRLDCKGRDI